MKNNGFRFRFMNKEHKDITDFRDAVSTILDYRYSDGSMYHVNALKDVARYIANVVGDGLDDWLSGNESQNNSIFNWTLDLKELTRECFVVQYDTELTDADNKEVDKQVALILVEEIKDSILLVMRELIILNSSEIVDIVSGNHRDLVTIDGYNMTINSGEVTKNKAIKTITTKNATINSFKVKRNQLRINSEIDKYEKVARKCYDAFLDEVEVYFEQISRDRKYSSNFKVKHLMATTSEEETLFNFIRNLFFDNLYSDNGIILDNIQINNETGVLTIDNFDVIGFEINRLLKDEDII